MFDRIAAALRRAVPVQEWLRFQYPTLGLADTGYLIHITTIHVAGRKSRLSPAYRNAGRFFTCGCFFAIVNTGQALAVGKSLAFMALLRTWLEKVAFYYP